MFTLMRRLAMSSHDRSLLTVVQQLDHGTRQALYAAANSGTLRRRTWDGCAFNQAGEMLGKAVRSKSEAAEAFKIPTLHVTEFIEVWDRLRGSDAHCTALLRDAILTAGLFPESASGTPSRRESDPSLSGG